jgi:hypothetical protein
VKVNSGTISGTVATYGGGTVNLADASGSIVLYTKTAATFSGTAYPTTPVSVTAIVVPYNTTKELMIRNTGDVQ